MCLKTIKLQNWAHMNSICLITLLIASERLEVLTSHMIQYAKAHTGVFEKQYRKSSQISKSCNCRNIGHNNCWVDLHRVQGQISKGDGRELQNAIALDRIELNITTYQSKDQLYLCKYEIPSLSAALI